MKVKVLKISALIVVFLLAITLISGSGCIDSSSEPVNETGLEEMTDNQADDPSDSFNDSIKTAPVENFSDKSNTLELEKESSFSGYYRKENLQFEADVQLIPCL